MQSAPRFQSLLMRLLVRLRADFLVGVMVLLPLGVIGYIAWSAYRLVDLSVLPVTRRVIGPNRDFLLPLVAIVLLLAFILLVGFLAKGDLGSRVTRRVNRAVDRIPVAGALIGAVRQVADTVLNKTEGNLKQTCLVEFPKAGTWVVGLVSAKPQGEIAAKIPGGEAMVAVYVGLPPFTAAFLLFVPKKAVIFLEMAAEDEVKLLATAGIAYPSAKD